MVSIIMSVYKEPLEYISQAVESMLNQTYKDIEVIVVVDDPKNHKAIDYLEQKSKVDSRLCIEKNEKNIGLVKSLNKAFKIAAGSFIGRMDADDYSVSNRLEKQLKYLIDNKLDLVGCNIIDIDENGRHIGGPTIYPETHKSVIRYARYNSPVAHPTWLARREVYEQLEGYRDINACEDYDFIVRAILSGFKIGNVQELLFRYRINSKGISSTKKAIQKTALFYLRNMYKKNKVPSIQEFNAYIESEEGALKNQSLNDYYRMTAVYKRKSSIEKALYLVYMIVFSSEFRDVVYNSIMAKINVKL